MPKQWTLLNDHSKLALIRAGFPSQELSQEDAKKILDDLVREGSDEDFHVISETVARNEMLQGKNYGTEYAIHLEYLRSKRVELRTQTTIRR